MSNIDVGDTVEVVDNSGSSLFTVGEKLTVSRINMSEDKTLIYVKEHDGGMYDFRFKLIKKGNSKMAIAKVGSKYKHSFTTTVYEVVYADEVGALIKWEGSGNVRAWIVEKDFYREYIEMLPEQWAVIYTASGNTIRQLDTKVFDSEAAARDYFKFNWPTSRVINKVVRLDN